MKTSRKITVYFKGEMFKMTLKELRAKGWNTLVNKSNGYSHDWQEGKKFEKTDIEIIGGVKTIWCTDKGTGFIQGTSSVSFS